MIRVTAPEIVELYKNGIITRSEARIALQLEQAKPTT